MMGYNSLGQKTAICHWKKYNTLLVILANMSCCMLIRMMLWNPDGVCGNNFDLLQQHQGYQITSIQEMSDGNGIVAQMKLLRGTEIFGPDIENLKLSVRYEEGDRLHVHITDAIEQRWQIPQRVIPRPVIENSHLLPEESTPEPGTEHRIRNPGRLATASTLELLYTVQPFGFAVIRKSNGAILFDTRPEGSSQGGAAGAAGANEVPPPPGSTITCLPSSFKRIVFKDQYIEVATALPSSSAIYGLGEGTRPDGMRLRPGRNYTLWATDVGSWNIDIALYSAYPFYMDVRSGGFAHGVLLLNSNGMDVEHTYQGLVYRVIGGVLDFYFFGGPSPAAVMDQFTYLVGRPAAMPYWSLGLHQSRYGYKNVEDLESVLAKYKQVNLPIESIWSDIDYMDGYKDFTLDPVNYPPKKLRPFVDQLHQNGQKFVMILDPGIKIDDTYKTYVHGSELDVFIMNGTRRYIAQVWPGATNMPDFLHPNAQKWWSKEVVEFHDLIPFDGLWLDMNEPANFCSGPNCYFSADVKCLQIDKCCMVCNNTNLSRWDDPPYKINVLGTHEPIYTQTVAMVAEHYGGVRAYDAHNIYGTTETIATYYALKEATKKRPFVLSRSLFVGAGAYAGHWTGDNGATWLDLQYSVASILNSGLFGVPMIGADICGFYFETSEELCRRWTQVGAFQPFARDHSDIHSGPQELHRWKSVADTAAQVFYWRYRLLPFFYTLLYEAHKTGAPIARPLFFEYPEDEETWSIDEQFLLGNALLVSPVLSPGQDTLTAYFPRGVWYNLFDLSKIVMAVKQGMYEHLEAPGDTINVHVRHGSIIPMQEFAMTTAATRKTPFSLLIAFSPVFDVAAFCSIPYSIACQGIYMEYATGQIFLDDDAQLHMEVSPGKGTLIKLEATRKDGHYVLKSLVTEGSYAAKQRLMLHSIAVLGVASQPYSVRINGKLTSAKVKMNATTNLMELSGLKIPIGKSFELAWKTMHSEIGAPS